MLLRPDSRSFASLPVAWGAAFTLLALAGWPSVAHAQPTVLARLGDSADDDGGEDADDDADADDDGVEITPKSRRKPTSSGFPPAPPPPEGKGIPTPVHEDPARFRGGVSAQFGAYFLESDVVGLFGIQGRLGAQIMDMFGLYATPGLQFGLGSDGAIARVSIGIIPELTVEDLFFFGAGPEVFGAIGINDNFDTFADANVFALRLRTGFAFGSKRPGRRHAFTIAFDSSVDFYDGRVGVAPTLALGYDAF